MVRHDKCAMKVGTDGSLLGAWASAGQSGKILDVGTGTGLIALMLAQRSEATIDAIDIDADACLQARENVAASPFARRVNIYHTPLSEYAPQHEGQYDLIVSNPPYFADSLKCPDRKRSIARHTDTLPLPDLLRDCRRLLAANGRIALILPYDQRENVLNACLENALFLSEEVEVTSVENAKPKRWLIELSADPINSPLLSRLTLETRERQYTEEFTALVKDFYLKI